MNPNEQDARLIFTQWAERQTECPVVEMLTVEEMLALGPEDAAAALEAREEAIANMTAMPLTHCWVPDDWWLFLAELCEKRVAQPGAVLELFVSGGIRAGKSYIAAMLMVSHWLYTKAAFLFCLSETEETSKDLQQAPIEIFLPPEVMGGERGAIKQSKHEKMKFSGGAFTGGAFERYLSVKDENGVEFQGGGKVRFRYFSQSVRRYRGFALTSAWIDEAAPAEHLAAVYDRLATGAVHTRTPQHQARMRALLPQLRALANREPGARRPHPALLGALLHGVSLWTYTPEEGFTTAVRRALQGAVKPEKFMRVVPELQNKPGVKDPRAPLIAYPANPSGLVGYLWSMANKIVPAYQELSRTYGTSDEQTIRIKLCGDAEAAEAALFGNFSDRHLFDWSEAPRDGSLYVMADPAFAKCWAVSIHLVDVAGRKWQLMRWPSPGWKVRTKEGGLMDPGPWAVATRTDKLNGDKGPSQKMRLNYTLGDHTHIVWTMLQRVLEKFRTTGEPWRGPRMTVDLHWEGEPDKALSGEVAWPVAFVGDKRWMGNPTERGKVRMPLHAALMLEENALPWLIHEGDAQRDGVILIQNALAADIGGLPGLLINRECADTIFALRTYSVPDGKDAPPENDQACKEDIDMLRMLMMWGPVHYSAQQLQATGGGSYGARR
jgi:hypothetical protein